MASDHEEFQRRRPRQSRSRATLEAILEAASQVLERDGPAGFNTTRVAERAGVSIGTLYQYFPDKQAILLAAARREVSAEAPSQRQKALMRGLIALLESFGRLAAPVQATPRQVRARTQSGDDRFERRASVWDMEVVDVFQALLDALAPAPRLQPIPIRSRRSYRQPR